MKGKNVLIVVLIIIIIGLIGFICYDKGLFKKQVKETKTEEKTTKEDKIETISIHSDEVTKATEILEQIYITEKDLYKSKSYDIKNISNYDLIATSMNVSGVNKYVAYCVGSKDQLKESLAVDEFNKSLDKYILDKKITVDTIKSLEKTSSYPLAQYEVNSYGIILTDNKVQLVGPCGAEGPYDFTDKKLEKAEKNSKNLYLYEKQAFAKWEIDEKTDDLVLDYYKDYARKELVEKNIEDKRTDTIKNNDIKWDLYNTYKYTFKIENGNYYFQSFELV